MVLSFLISSNGAVFYSFDALFIGRRKNAGQSCGSPNFGEVMFFNQENVDKYVNEYNPPAKQTEVCIVLITINILRGLPVRFPGFIIGIIL